MADKIRDAVAASASASATVVVVVFEFMLSNFKLKPYARQFCLCKWLVNCRIMLNAFEHRNRYIDIKFELKDGECGRGERRERR